MMTVARAAAVLGVSVIAFLQLATRTESLQPSYHQPQPQQLTPKTTTMAAMSRQEALATLSGLLTGGAALANLDSLNNGVAWAAEGSSNFNFEIRDRKNNKEALIREDYWYMTGKLPPRLLSNPLQQDDPGWNAFGSCTSADGGNPCTYVSLKQRGPAYSKYASTIFQGAKEYQALGGILQQSEPSWDQAVPLIRADLGAAAVDAELKLILLATALTTSPNFPVPSKELLVARFYANEVHYAQKALLAAVETRDQALALEAWKFGKGTLMQNHSVEKSFSCVDARPIVCFLIATLCCRPFQILGIVISKSLTDPFRPRLVTSSC